MLYGTPRGSSPLQVIEGISLVSAGVLRLIVWRVGLGTWLAPMRVRFPPRIFFLLNSLAQLIDRYLEDYYD